MRSLGNVEGGAETIIQALLDVLGKNGTLLLPALSFKAVTTESPYFDVQKTPSCIGALPEYFRQRDRTVRSLHPTHSVCSVGMRSHELLSGHEKDTTPCGANSTFHKLPHYKGQILFLGCGLRPNTSVHAIEELSEPPYLYDDVFEYEITDTNCQVLKMAIRAHNFEGWTQRYDRLAQVLDRSVLQIGKVLDADCHLVEATAMWSAVHETLKEDAFFFVDKTDLEDA